MLVILSFHKAVVGKAVTMHPNVDLILEILYQNLKQVFKKHYYNTINLVYFKNYL